MRIRDNGGIPETSEASEASESSETPTSPDRLLGEIGLDGHAIREILDDVTSEPALDLRG